MGGDRKEVNKHFQGALLSPLVFRAGGGREGETSQEPCGAHRIRSSQGGRGPALSAPGKEKMAGGLSFCFTERHG